MRAFAIIRDYFEVGFYGVDWALVFDFFFDVAVTCALEACDTMSYYDWLTEVVAIWANFRLVFLAVVKDADAKVLKCAPFFGCVVTWLPVLCFPEEPAPVVAATVRPCERPAFNFEAGLRSAPLDLGFERMLDTFYWCFLVNCCYLVDGLDSGKLRMSLFDKSDCATGVWSSSVYKFVTIVIAVDARSGTYWLWRPVLLL